MDEETLRKLRESSGLWLDAEGDFWQADGRVEHARTREVLHRGVHRAADGRWAVRVGREWAYLEVRDAAFFVRDLLIDEARATAQGTLTSGEQHEFDLHTITLGARDALYLRRADGER
ncbi:MAG: hypothetical protein JST92_24995, partial [Deltaproteobacteria bacterium]|nr:hypothetical protein [Deltaproteobacteria bacterium]